MGDPMPIVLLIFPIARSQWLPVNQRWWCVLVCARDIFRCKLCAFCTIDCVVWWRNQLCKMWLVVWSCTMGQIRVSRASCTIICVVVVIVKIGQCARSGGNVYNEITTGYGAFRWLFGACCVLFIYRYLTTR